MVWDNCTNALKQNIEAVLIEAARIVTGASKLCNTQHLISELQWESLESRRKHHRLVLMYTLKTHHSFHAKQNCIPILSFLPQSVNGTTYHNQQEMPNHPKYSKPNFKLKNTFNYNSGARINQLLHCRLRLGCSSLNHDPYRKKSS